MVVALAMAAALAGLAGCRTNIYCPDSLGACPATVPDNGAPCTGSSPIGGCEYGDDPWRACNMVAICAGSSGWNVQPEHDPSCPTMLGGSCPATLSDAQATPTCSGGPMDNPTCRYPEGVCDCLPGQGPFSCTPPAQPGCPATRPRSGAPCSGQCKSWGSGLCDNESMICACGVWQLVECTD
jgi:hypothetical protein